MKIVIDIPKEFESEYKRSLFKEFFGRVMADMNCLCGNYEKETAEMFIKAFDESRELQIPKWHLCSEELPTDYENVLVDYEYFRYGDYNCMFRTVGIAYYSHEYDSWHVEGGGQQIKIHAWMELPNFEGVE